MPYEETAEPNPSSQCSPALTTPSPECPTIWGVAKRWSEVREKIRGFFFNLMKPVHLATSESLLPSFWGSPSIRVQFHWYHVGHQESHSVGRTLTKSSSLAYYILIATSIFLGWKRSHYPRTHKGCFLYLSHRPIYSFFSLNQSHLLLFVCYLETDFYCVAEANL